MMEIIPTNTCPPDLQELSRRSEGFSKFASAVHLDVADAVFAPTISWPYQSGQRSEIESMAQSGTALPYSDTLTYEAHLMVKDASEIGALACSLRLRAHHRPRGNIRVGGQGADNVRLMEKKCAKEIGIAILADTPLEALEPYIELCQSVTVMTIASIGKQGIPFDERGYGRVTDLHNRYPDMMIEVDGGVGKAQIATLARSGAQRFGVGSAISQSADPAGTHKELLDLAQKAL